MRPPDWHLYRSFLAVLREGGLSQAARALALTQPTVGRHIAELERLLAAPLFMRSQTGLFPTPAALSLGPHAEAMASAADALIRAASGESDQPKGTVRLAASEFVGALVLPPILARFHELHPKIAVELALSNRNADLLRHDADIAVRMAPPTQDALIARRIGDVSVGLFAHRSYLKQRGMPRDIADLVSRHVLIGFDRDDSAMRASRERGIPITRELFALRTDSDHAQFHALCSGMGVAGCQAAFASMTRDLLPVLPQLFHFRIGMWLVMHEDLRASRRVRTLFDYLAPALLDYVKMPKARPVWDGQGKGDILYPPTFRERRHRDRRNSK